MDGAQQVADGDSQQWRWFYQPHALLGDHEEQGLHRTIRSAGGAGQRHLWRLRVVSEGVHTGGTGSVWVWVCVAGRGWREEAEYRHHSQPGEQGRGVAGITPLLHLICVPHTMDKAWLSYRG